LLRAGVKFELIKGRLSFHLLEDKFLPLIARQGERKSRTQALFSGPQNMGSNRDLVKTGLGHG